MKIIYKDKERFKNLIFKNGYNPSSLSLAIGMHRQYISQSLRNETIGARPAKEIADKLQVRYEELFEIIE